VYSVVDDQGNPVLEKASSDPPVSTKCFVQILQNKLLSDRLSSVGGELLLSHKLSIVIKGRNLCPAIRSLPVKVRDRKGGIIATYEVFFTSKRHDAIDRRWSAIKWLNGHILHVEKYVLSAHLLPQFEMFGVIPLEWIVTEPIVSAIKKAGCTDAFSRRFR